MSLDVVYRLAPYFSYGSVDLCIPSASICITVVYTISLLDNKNKTKTSQFIFCGYTLQLHVSILIGGFKINKHKVVELQGNLMNIYIGFIFASKHAV
jgi:hypothetical protein